MKSLYVLAALLTLMIPACSHVQKADKDELSELAQLQDAVRVLVEQKITAQAGVREIKEFHILSSQESGGVAKITYRLTYSSQSDFTGTVDNTVEAEVTLNKKSEQIWSIAQITPRSQVLEFHEPIEIIGSVKK